ncbi:phage portal protein [Paenibacillus sinopodophylli]|uniref:phage portal protein n=1 Tax=Paenibacillus sinopodophylli TaxID=1837342 RepID=UPI00110C97DB|nr:phage portal protein [Paenibacillus sinopodophylli]
MSIMGEYIAIIEQGAKSGMSMEQIILNEISLWDRSPEKKQMLQGEAYYNAEQDILKSDRKVVAAGGGMEPAANIANRKLVHSFLRKLVDQKVGYALAKPMNVQTDNDAYQKDLKERFNKSMLRLLQRIGVESINKGRSWMHVYYSPLGKLSYKRIPAEEIIPIWNDDDHTELHAIIRVYKVESYEGTTQLNVTKVEYWDANGVKRYVLQGNLIPDVDAPGEAHFNVVEGGKESPLNWERVPFICFKYNPSELPLLQFLKSLVDDYDKMKSDNASNLEDLPNSIYKVKNFSGTSGDEFRAGIAKNRVVFTGDDGDVDTISLDIDTEAYKNHMEMNRKDIYEFGRGVDTQSEKLGGDKSGVALRFLYADLDMDCNMWENEFQAALEQLVWFMNTDLYNSSDKDYFDEPVDFIFNRDILINEAETIKSIQESVGVLSQETLVANHPYVTDTNEELKRIEEEEKKAMETIDNFPALPNEDGTGGAGGGGA